MWPLCSLSRGPILESVVALLVSPPWNHLLPGLLALCPAVHSRPFPSALLTLHLIVPCFNPDNPPVAPLPWVAPLRL